MNMRTFLVGIVAIAGCAIGNAQTFDFHALTVSGHSRYAESNNPLKESLQKEGSRPAIATTLPLTTSPSVPVAPVTVPVQPPQGPPIGAVMVGAVCVLAATGGCFLHLMRRQTMRAV
jgi:hypothetical protein